MLNTNNLAIETLHHYVRIGIIYNFKLQSRYRAVYLIKKCPSILSLNQFPKCNDLYMNNIMLLWLINVM